MSIKFWGQCQPCFFLSNFYIVSFKLQEKTWPSSEHFYQAMKVSGTEWEEKIRLQERPSSAASLGRSVMLRADWEEVKERVMVEAITAKFSQNKAMRFSLLDTGDEELVEASPYDSYWGVGKDGSGKNRLGVLLMELRKKLRFSNVENTSGGQLWYADPGYEHDIVNTGGGVRCTKCNGWCCY